jgi:hypothetical protein
MDIDLYDQAYTYLHETLDPIGVKAFGENGEHASFTDDIILMIIRKVRINQLANHLQFLVEETMSLENFIRNFHVETAYDLLALSGK